MDNHLTKTRILLVDDDPTILESMAPWLREQGYEVEEASGVSRAIELIGLHNYDLALIDIRLADGDGFEVLRFCRENKPNTIVLLMTGYGTIETGVEAIRAGAFDLLTKPLIDQELLMSMNRALSQREVIEENKQLKAQLDIRFGMENVVGNDHQMKKVYDMVDSIADTRATVLVTGESGTGKSMIARAIHRQSSRRNKAFVEVACGSLPENLLESELFGHVAGAFTGATSDKQGKFLQADGGTIFLDEIGTASPSFQVRLLRVLQEMEFEAVGGSKTHKVDARVILATNEDLQKRVAEGTFRQDLYYRIDVINIKLPSVRERLSDIPALAQHFLEKVSQETGRGVQGFTQEALNALQNYRWPGNVREMQNVIERAVLLGKSEVITLENLPSQITLGATTTVATPSASGEVKTLKDALEGPERQIILETLRRHQWNRNETAEALGINRTTLYKKMKKLGLEAIEKVDQQRGGTFEQSSGF
ncbi:MAG: sigma-54 dependent transcriptional regulator [Pirellulaceae bacterium]|nr:sigma-54 dependent transcriptional regulator [Pirellulaceae bacterium]